MPGVTCHWNPNIPRMIKLIDSEETQLIRDVHDPHGSQDIEKSQIRTHNLMRTYFGKTGPEGEMRGGTDPKSHLHHVSSRLRGLPTSARMHGPPRVSESRKINFPQIRTHKVMRTYF